MKRRSEIAEALEEIGLLLELLGENPFRIRAYRNAARILRSGDPRMDEGIRAGRLAVKGIGPGLASAIVGFARTGRLPLLDELRAQVPPGLRDWLRIPGLGPRKARAIHLHLGASSLEELEEACRTGKLRTVPGFGEKSERGILQAIERIRGRSGLFLIPLLRAEAERLVDEIRSTPGCVRAEVAGAVRRSLETAKGVELVAAAADPEALLEAFTKGSSIAHILERSRGRATVRLRTGPVASLSVVAPPSFPVAWIALTGSEEHTRALRRRAQGLGLDLGEFALVRKEDGQPVPCSSEPEVYRALGLDWIPPELREGRGEIEAAERGTLPELVRMEDVQGILHVHSTWSDGSATIRELAEAARAMGMRYLAVCDHSASARYARGLTIERLEAQRKEIASLNREYGGEFVVLHGAEVDILPDGSLDHPDEVLRSLDLVVASVHTRFHLSAEEQTERIVRAIENPYVDILGHPTGRLLLEREGYPLDLERVVEAAAERGVAIEINAHPQRLDLDWRELPFGLERGLKTAIDPDAHDAAGLGDIVYGVGIARKGWCSAGDVLNAWPLERLRESLSARRRRAEAGRSSVACSGDAGSARSRRPRGSTGASGGELPTVGEPSRAAGR